MSKPLSAISAAQPLATQVYEHLREKITSGVYKPGQCLVEQELSKELGVSRTPIREAILRLTEYGLVQCTGRSAQVRILSADDAKNLFQVRRALELEAVRLACGKLTVEDFAALAAADPGDPPAEGPTREYELACRQFDIVLHSTIAVRSGNPLLVAKLDKLKDQVHLICKHTVDRMLEHREIVKALQANDRRAARRAMAHHLTAAYRLQLRSVRAAEAASRSRE